jgi:hypothetical protein
MAKTYTVTELTAPASPTATLEAGGSLTASTTYYYLIIACDGANSVGDVMAESPPSAEVSATTDATNKSIKLDWTAVTGATRYTILRSTTSGDYATATAHCLSQAGVTTNTYTDDGSVTLNRWTLRTAGMIKLAVSGGTSGDRVTMQNIYDYLVGAGYTSWVERSSAKVNSNWGLSYVFHLSPFIIDYWQIEPAISVIFDCTGMVLGGDALIGVAGSGYGGKTGTFLGYLAKNMSSFNHRWSGKFEIYDTKIQDFGRIYYDSSSKNYYCTTTQTSFREFSATSGASKIYGCLLELGGATVHGGQIDFRNTTFVDTGMRIEKYIDQIPTFTDCYFYQDTNPIYTYVGPHLRLDNPIFTYAAYEIYVHGPSLKMQVYFNPKWYNNPVKVYWRNNPDNHYMLKWSFSMAVLDIDGNAISGARVTLVDKNGYSILWEDTGETITSDITNTATTINSSDGSTHAVGDVIIFNEDRATITNISTNTLTVTRGTQGAIAKACDATAKIYKQLAYIDTDANGEIPDQETIEWVATPKSTGSSGNLTTAMDLDEFSPYTLTVIKSGYQTKTMVLTMDRKREEVVVLEKQVKFITAGGDHLLWNLKATDSQNKHNWAKV